MIDRKDVAEEVAASVADRRPLVKSYVFSARDAGKEREPSVDEIAKAELTRRAERFSKDYVAAAAESAQGSAAIADPDQFAFGSLIGTIYLDPPYDLETLSEIWENSSNLRPCIDAYVNNIDGFGHRFEPVIDLDKPDADQKIADALYADRVAASEAKGAGDDVPEPTPEEVAAARAKLAQDQRRQLARLNAFFSSCTPDMSFVGLRRRTRLDVEVLGNGYWEVTRNRLGGIAQINYLPAYTMRILPLTDEDRMTDQKVRVQISDLSWSTLSVTRRYRRFVQVSMVTPLRTSTSTYGQGSKPMFVYFKSLGDPRAISSKTGRQYKDVAELEAKEPESPPATEIVHFGPPNPRSPYGLPRWSGALLAVVGTRQAEEVNFLYFDNKSIPPYVMLVSGGKIADGNLDKIRDFFETQFKGRKNFSKFLIVEAEPFGAGDPTDVASASKMKIELKSLMDAQRGDGLFMKYEEANADKVGMAYRLPRLLRGDIRDFNRATAEASLVFGEQQVFGPEREDFDFQINRRLMPLLRCDAFRFVSQTAVTKDPAQLAEILKAVMPQGILTANEGREIAQDLFNREYAPVDDEWGSLPPTFWKQKVSTGQDLSAAEADAPQKPGDVPPGEPGSTEDNPEVVKVPAQTLRSWLTPEGRQKSSLAPTPPVKGVADTEDGGQQPDDAGPGDADVLEVT